MRRSGSVPRLGRLLIAGAILLTAAALAAAEFAEVHLRSGFRMRGEVTVTPDAVIVRNMAGEVRLDPADVLRIVPLEQPETPPETQPSTQPATRPAPPATQPVPPAPPSTRPATQPAEPRPEEPAEPPDDEDRPPPEAGPEDPDAEPAPAVATPLAPAPPIGDADIQRLKLLELPRDLRDEDLRVRFLRRGRQRDLALEVLDELRSRPDFDARWEEVLTRGTVNEKFELILRETGGKHADRIEIVNDPEVFRVFRRRVLPMLTRGCAASGCHGGVNAREFRFPAGIASGEPYGYATFAMLDRMQTSMGPLINRDLPEQSVLLSFMLPPEDTINGHPPVGRGPRFRPLVRRTDDPHYKAVLEWIDSLAHPRPEYGLEYEPLYPGRGRPPVESEDAEQVGGEAPATAPAEPGDQGGAGGEQNGGEGEAPRRQPPP